MTFLNTIADIKNQTGIALAEALNNLGSEFAERDLAMQWLSALQKEGIFHEEGWYAPPPRGIISLLGKPDNQFERAYASLHLDQNICGRAKTMFTKARI